MMTLLIIYGALSVIGMVVLTYGIKHAKTVDPKEAFLSGDYGV